MSENAREAILEAARRKAQAHGYGGLNLRDIASDVGIKAASIYYHFPGKAELGAAVAKRYWEDTAKNLEALTTQIGDPIKALNAYPGLFRRSLEEENRMCLCSFMAAEYDDLPDAVKTEVQAFADINVAWLSTMLAAALIPKAKCQTRARAIFAAVAGAQLIARSRADLSLFDALINSFREAGLMPK
ncbi:TetR/AcrR family transcriptional regulator [Acidisoma cellulosilytica]|uniref:TetR/AcrR family transcriptional regulator n=1 Tax=Acidisoma cellulosilyticum TaxID=2802395 RepID=A0A963Z6C0_9PROT|nr:TetR/AcrR family transcriptional regulator [Acidisoma cellulosilyticum]MCB8882638.1 TetR/AcrR family transcriptional regulator [Acidisoma cellulosilyticum]